MHRILTFAAVVLASVVRAGEPSALERVIIQDARAVLSREVEGGLHCPVRLPGSFDELADAPMRRLRQLRESVLKDVPYEETRSFRDAAAGRGTFVPSKSYADWLQQAAGPARQVRAALCARSGRAAPQLMLFGGWGEKAPYRGNAGGEHRRWQCDRRGCVHPVEELRRPQHQHAQWRLPGDRHRPGLRRGQHLRLVLDHHFRRAGGRGVRAVAGPGLEGDLEGTRPWPKERSANIRVPQRRG